MSARRRLHLSYIGQGVRDGKPRNPAAPLAELLAELDRRCGVAIDADDDRRPWLVRHPLQPFDDRYFNPASDRDTALFSYSRRFASMHGRGEKPLPRFREDSAGQPDQWPEQLPLKDLVDYFKDPAKHILRSGLELSLDALDDDAELPEDEPLEGLARVHDVARKVFLRQVLPRACAEPAWEWDGAVPDWVSFGGLLPLGSEGEATWHAEADAVLALRERADATGRFDARGAAGARAIRVDVPLLPPGAPSPVRVTGTVRNVFPLKEHEDGLQVVFAYPKPGKNGPLKEAEEISFRDQIPAFLQWALLRLRTCATTPVRLTLLAKDEPDLASGANAWDEGFIVADDDTRTEMADDLQYRIGLLLSFWRDGRAGRSRYYPRTGWAVVRKLKEEEANSPTPLDEDARLRIASNASRAKWLTQQLDSPGERDYAPGYALLLEGDLVFGDSESDPEATALKQLMEDCMRLDAVLSLGAAADVAQNTMEAPDDQQ
jgi:exodeoxyribonuclease V gamma subunit